ncbi:MAG: 3-isopropylmalate dehydratase small subunit [Gemmatimonadota bacterium]
MPPITHLTSPAILLALDDIDTDQIIPARFLKTTERQGLGRHLFADWRYAADGTSLPGFILNAPSSAGRRILVAGRNFGCGSSREHAPWALADCGFQAVIAPSFADIFRNNALKNGLVPVQLSPGSHDALVRQLTERPDEELHLNIAKSRLDAFGASHSFPLAPFARHCLLEGIDQLGYLLGAQHEIARYEAGHPAAFCTTS